MTLANCLCLSKYMLPKFSLCFYRNHAACPVSLFSQKCAADCPKSEKKSLKNQAPSLRSYLKSKSIRCQYKSTAKSVLSLVSFLTNQGICHQPCRTVQSRWNTFCKSTETGLLSGFVSMISAIKSHHLRLIAVSLLCAHFSSSSISI